VLGLAIKDIKEFRAGNVKIVMRGGKADEAFASAKAHRTRALAG
jgi:hypothetical protein